MKCNFLLIGLTISALFSCRTEESCKVGENYVKEEVFHLILSEKPKKISMKGKFFYEVKGTDVNNTRDTIINLYNIRWYESFYYLWDEGDTLIKSKESLITEIHKKDTIYYMQWDCNDPKINGISTKLSKPPQRK